VRAVLDVNILISALLGPSGTPAHLLTRWLYGDFDLIVSPQLLAELQRALAYPKLRTRVSGEDAVSFIQLLGTVALTVEDDPNPPRRSRDPGDDYLVAVAEESRAALVSSDAHLLELSGIIPVYSAQAFIEWLDSSQPAAR
jgi:putative PIN family toxin of toxin-antitoxin system